RSVRVDKVLQAAHSGELTTFIFGTDTSDDLALQLLSQFHLLARDELTRVFLASNHGSVLSTSQVYNVLQDGSEVEVIFKRSHDHVVGVFTLRSTSTDDDHFST